jgi:hypothetical protein
MGSEIMVNGIETVAVYVTPEVAAELGEVLKSIKVLDKEVGGIIDGSPIRTPKYLNDAIEYLIEVGLQEDAY